MRTKTFHELQRRWRRQIAARQSRQPGPRRRDVGAIGFLVDGGRASGLVELSRVLLVVVYDAPDRRRRSTIRLCGYRARCCEHGVLWGGPRNVQFSKDLSLCPRPGARGMRVDSRRTGLLELALRLDHRIDQAMRLQPSAHNRQFRLPRVWAGYDRSRAAKLCGDGPEFEDACRWLGMTREATLQKFRRSQDGLTLFPMDWVSGELDGSTALFADVEALPRRQLFQLGEHADGQLGYQGAAAYDFCNNASFTVMRKTRISEVPFTTRLAIA
jgi:hypothetical protein